MVHCGCLILVVEIEGYGKRSCLLVLHDFLGEKKEELHLLLEGVRVLLASKVVTESRP